MINEVITEILQAEQTALDIRAKAQAKAEEIFTETDKNCAQINQQAQEKARAEKQRITAESKQTASEEYKKILDESNAQASALIKEKESAIKQTGEQIFGRIINGNC